MKRYIKKSIAVIAVVAVLLGGCTSSKDNKTSATSNSSSHVSEAQSSTAKTQLVWLTNSQALQQDSEVYTQFNKLLAKKGCDFEVKFTGIEQNKFESTLKTMKSSGKQADIVFSDFGYDNSVYSSYYSNVMNGIYEPLDTYLKSPDGKKLYSAFDEKAWSGSKVNGKIYAVRPLGSLAQIVTWQFNNDLIKKYNINVGKLSANLWDYSSALKSVYQGEKSNSSFAAIYLPNGASPVSSRYDTLTSAAGVTLSDTSAKAVNIYSDDYTRKFIETLKEYSDLGYVKKDAENFFMTQGWYSIGNSIEGHTAELYSGSGFKTVNTSYIQTNNAYVKSESSRFGFNGIASWSKHKDEAFKLLTLVNTDADLANTLAFGVEGRNYVLKDGYVQAKSDNSSSGEESASVHLMTIMSFGNPLILHPNKQSGIYKGVDYRAENKKAKPSPILGFFFDDSKVEKEVAATDAVAKKYAYLWQGSEPNADTALAQMNSELKAAGIDKVLDEANRQIAAWKKSKK